MRAYQPRNADIRVKREHTGLEDTEQELEADGERCTDDEGVLP
jgi:hypothetical protein